MRFPYPDRFKWKTVSIYAVLLFVAQLAIGTDVRFAALVALFILLSAGAFNAAGGLNYTSGAYIFFNSVLILLLGVTYKTILLEPGQTHLLAPYTTLLVYCGGMASMWLAAFVNARLRPKRGLMSSLLSEDTMLQSAIGCLGLGVFFMVGFGSIQQGGGSFGSAIAQINHFPDFAIILATVYEIRVSRGRRAWNWVVITQVSILFAYGVIYTSKQGMFVGPVTWAVTAIVYKFDFKPKLLIGGSIFIFFMLYYMVPFSQYVRLYRDKDGSRQANQKVALEYIFKLNEVRALYLASEQESVYDNLPHFYDKEEGLLDRLCAIGMDDGLVAHTDDGFVFGLYPVYHGVMSLVPKILWPGKPFFATGNEYGRELGVIPPDDVTTGISFSPEADAYHEAKFFGIFVVMPLICFAYFLANDSFLGSVRNSPWPLLPIILASHLAPEGGLDSMILQIGEGTLGILFLAFVVRYVLPLMLRVMTGGERTVVRRTIDFRLGAEPLRRPEAGEPAVVSSTSP